EATTGGRYYHQRSLHRIFTSADERAFWATRRQEPTLAGLLAEPEDHPTIDLPAPDGVGEVKGTGWLDVPAMLKRVRDWLLAQGSLMEAEFHPSRLTDTPEGVRWQSDSGEVFARKAIFCEGYRMVMNPFFRWLPMRPAKGELLLIEVPGLHLDHLTHRGLFLVPMGGARYWAGATYAWGDLQPDPTEAQRQHIIEKLEKLLGRPFNVLAHQTGIRPTVRDRRPLIGLHPARPNLAVFNGLGTKGVMLVPHFAEQFTAFLQGNAVLDPAVNIDRFAHCLNGPVPRAGGLDKPIT
ncbi:MAG: FAD-dependent oxidoreductase, partial [Bacteroidota bacterium]